MAMAAGSGAAPRVLVTFASRHGSAEEVAREIGRRLTAAGCTASVLSAEAVTTLMDYDACVIGSSIYMGRWLSDARAIPDRHAADLRSKPVWLFSVGPLGDPPKPEGEPDDGRKAAREIGAVEHRVFAGRLDRSLLSFPEKATTRMVGAPEGDYRDWTAIRAWADGIAAQLGARPA